MDFLVKECLPFSQLALPMLLRHLSSAQPEAVYSNTAAAVLSLFRTFVLAIESFTPGPLAHASTIL